MNTMRRLGLGAACALLLWMAGQGFAQAQDWVRTGTNLGAQKIRIAAANFKPGSGDPQISSLKQVFDTTLFSDLQNAGIFDMVSKSMAPPLMPGSQQDVQLASWSAAPSNAEMLAFGTFSINAGQIAVTGFLDDTKNTQSPQILGKQYSRCSLGRERAAHRAPVRGRDHRAAGRHSRHRRDDDLLCLRAQRQ